MYTSVAETIGQLIYTWDLYSRHIFCYTDMLAHHAWHISFLGRSVKYIEFNRKNLFSVAYESDLKEVCVLGGR